MWGKKKGFGKLWVYSENRDENHSVESVVSELLRLSWGESRETIGNKEESRVVQTFKRKDTG